MTSLKLKTLLASLALAASGMAAAQNSLLNVSYDVAREFYKDYNTAFAAHYKKTTGQDVKIDQSHAGSSAQARAVNDGLAADVVTMNTTTDVQFLADNGVVAKDWAKKFPNDASPTTSTMLFLVRNGNPKNIKDWDDLIKPGVGIVTPNPKTSGGARWNYLAAWAFALKQPGGNDDSARDFVGKLFRNVKVLDSGARGATTTFAERGIGDVLLAWENEAFLAQQELGPDKFEIVVPRQSILAEPSVALVDRNVDRHGTREVAQAYLRYLYSPEGQRIAARHYYRPRHPEHAAPADVARFPQVRLVTIRSAFGSWEKAQAEHFADGGVFDQIYSN